MVCKKCGMSFNDNINTCPFCGVGQENHINIKRLENELERLKIGENTSNFNDVQNTNEPNLDVEDIIDILENFKIKEKEINDTPIPRVEPVSDEVLIELISDIKENKELFITDKSQYQYIPKKVDEPELIDVSENTTNNIGLNDLYKKQKLYIPEEPKPEKDKLIELPKVVTNEIFEIDRKNKQKKYRRDIIISSIILIFVALITILFSYKFILSTKAKFIKNISSSYTEIQNIINKYTTNYTSLLSDDNISLNSIITIKTTENDKSNSEVLNVKYIEDKKNKSQYYEYTNFNNIKTKYNKTLIKENKLYVNKENQINEFYYTDARFISILNNNNIDNTEYMFYKLLDSIKENIDDSNFKTKSVKENNEKFKEYTFTLDEKLFSKIYSSYLNNIKEDEKALDIIKDTFQYSNVELITKINEELKELETKTSDKIVLTYKFYIVDNKIIKHYLNYNNFEIILSNNTDVKEIYINKDEQRILYLKLKSIDTNTNRYNITLNYDNYELLGNYYEENNKIILNYQKKYNDNKNEIVNLVLSKGNKEDNKYTNNISIAYQNTNNSNVISKNITVTNVLETGSQIPQLNVDNTSNLMNDNLKNELKEKFSMFIK